MESTASDGVVEDREQVQIGVGDEVRDAAVDKPLNRLAARDCLALARPPG